MPCSAGRVDLAACPMREGGRGGTARGTGGGGRVRRRPGAGRRPPTGRERENSYNVCAVTVPYWLLTVAAAVLFRQPGRGGRGHGNGDRCVAGDAGIASR